eukprot:CAMPEP_0183331770 /NCGR_PEP_ID=MMETSP0164_2-20130417/1094_1 /TAXON_ID=221442 /ORGANISM="Coccolithus pelagicus ssp braarudi, Strain PLY182g" /LENGTH=160 /DNA_ID=CAMNT_0025500341 /DNA_START=29 /DNA_END=511 /DNA_ORIENTATION=+
MSATRAWPWVLALVTTRLVVHAGDESLHEQVALTPNKWDQVVALDTHIWAVKWHSGMCSACQAFAPEWDMLRELVDGLHWGEVDIDRKENIPLALQMGVLSEGVPNVKLYHAGEATVPILSGDEDTRAVTLSQTITRALEDANAVRDTDGFYVSTHHPEL